MAELKHIIKSLKANYIVLIENDLSYVTEPHLILAMFCAISDFQRERLLTSLDILGKNDTASRLDAFKVEFDALDHNESLQTSLLPDDLMQYLIEMQAEAILSKELIGSLEMDLQEQTVKEAFLRSGIYSLTDVRYDALLRELVNVPGVELAYYRSKPVPTEMQGFLEELRHGLSRTDSHYYIAVVDKMLGEGQEESGKAFIEHDLIRLNGDNQLKCLAFLFTSQAITAHPNRYEDYFVREIQKGSGELVAIISGYLTDSSYASVFKYFEENIVKAAYAGLTMALKNQQNVKHVIKKSINEGISPFESLRGWFDQIVQYQIDFLHIKDINYYFALTNFFDSQSLIDHAGIKEYGPDLERLNSFELFDYEINKKGLPIFPGDIFRKDEDYYVLVGQVCDLLIRDSGKRGAKVAELLKFKVSPFPPEDEQEKFSVSVEKNGKKRILIQHFFDFIDGSYGVADIEITSKNTFYGDFHVLDLCHFNENGVAELPIVGDFEEYKNVPWVTKERYGYLEKLRSYFIENKDVLIAGKAAIDSEVVIFSSSDLNEDSTKFSFGFERVARLKGRFYDSLYQQLINYKARIDLNLIDQAIETTAEIQLAVKYNFVETTEVIDVSLIRIKSHRNFVHGNDVVDGVSGFFKTAVSRYDRFLEGGKPKEYQFTGEGGNYVLEIPLRYTDKENKLKNVESANLRFARLFKEPLENKKFIFVDNEEADELNDEGEISLANIYRGIKLLQNNFILKMEDGRIEKTPG